MLDLASGIWSSISLQASPFREGCVDCYYNGGCFFDATYTPRGCVPSGHEVLATYDNGLPTIVRCRVGTGIALLSGVHFEHPLLDKAQEADRKKFILDGVKPVHLWAGYKPPLALNPLVPYTRHLLSGLSEARKGLVRLLSSFRSQPLSD